MPVWMAAVRASIRKNGKRWILSFYWGFVPTWGFDTWEAAVYNLASAWNALRDSCL